MNKPISPAAVIRGEEHWTDKGSEVRLFLWNKHAGDPSGPAGRILFVHGSSMASQRMTAAGEIGLFTVRLLVLDVSPRLFNHLIGTGLQRERHVQPQSLGGAEVDDEFELGGLLNR